ncbi:MAG TPA: response regulator transcription factor [Steroidobacteraceae bacterium]|nr:response regulator transcription factor [Steroidobacteraceae bacterium]
MSSVVASASEEDVRPQVLIVDDDRKFVRLLSGYLQTHGLNVGAAYDGADALTKARTTGWNVIILDLMLPRIDGVEVLRLLRTFSEVPVLMLTGRGAETDQVRGLDSGADDYLPKTSSARHVLARVHALLRRAAVTAQQLERVADSPREPLVAGVLRLDLEARRLMVNEKIVALTAVEFDLLAYLVSNRGRVRARDQIMEQVHDRRLESFARSIDMHISSLRRKLSEHGAAHYIQTVRGIGYLLEVR